MGNVREYWEHGWEHPVHPHACGEYVPAVVSILVLVEVLPWGGASGLPPVGPRQCFNPCSGGSIALGRRSLAPGLRALSVSILVLVEVLPWVATDVLARLRAQRFQSLFWWKYCPGTIAGIVRQL